MNAKRTERITHVMEPVIPGCYAVLTVGGATDETRVWAFSLADGPSGAPGGGSLRPVGPAIPLPVVQRTEDVLTVDVPAGLPGVWALHLQPQFDAAAAWVVNRPQLNWCYAHRLTPGAEIRLLGRNLVRFDRYPTSDPEHPVSWGGLLSFDDSRADAPGTRVWLRPTGGGRRPGTGADRRQRL